MLAPTYWKFLNFYVAEPSCNSGTMCHPEAGYQWGFGLRSGKLWSRFVFVAVYENEKWIDVLAKSSLKEKYIYAFIISVHVCNDFHARLSCTHYGWMFVTWWVILTLKRDGIMSGSCILCNRPSIFKVNLLLHSGFSAAMGSKHDKFSIIIDND